jgi:hypothetical protein
LGQPSALLETCVLHSGHEISAMASDYHVGALNG